MKRAHLVFFITVVVGLITTLAAATIYAQDTMPRITYFLSDKQSVSLNEVQQGTAQIPVHWSVFNRPQTADLVFEQYLPASQTYRNVELPRPWSWVNSTDVGVVKPVVPDDGTNTIHLRLKVVDRFTQVLLAEAQLDIDIHSNTTVTISEFTAAQNYASRVELENDSEIIGVSWRVVNRPANSNLVFEQVLPDGRLRNAELPRDNPYVTSEGTGAVALVDVGSADSVTVQLRLVDLPSDNTITSRSIELPIADVDDSPHIVSFVTDTGHVSWSSLAQRNGLVPVSWQVVNRPPASNLVFEQVMADGTFRNAELPRDNPYVSSGGAGHMAPVLPGINATEIVLQVRLINLWTGQTHDTRQIQIPIVYPELAEGTPETPPAETGCFPWMVSWDRDMPCAEIEPQSMQAAYQPFEHGFMVWHDDIIWAFYDSYDGIVINDTYEGGEIVFDEEPPAGLYQPINGFGKAWVENESLRETLGWATGTEQSYTMEIQSAAVDGSKRLYGFSIPGNLAVLATISGSRIESYAQPVQR